MDITEELEIQDESSGAKSFPVELGVCFTDSTWKRAIVYVPNETRPCNIDRIARARFLNLYDGKSLVEHTWVQCYGDDLREQIRSREAN